MAGPRARDFEESVGLLANDDLYDADSDSAIRPTPEERNSPSPVIRPSKIRQPERNLNGKRDRRVNLLTKFSLCISGLNFLILITALIIIPAGKFSGSGSWTSTGYHHYKAEAATGLIVLSITVSLLPFNHFHPAFVDLMLVCVLFSMGIYAVTVGYPTENWCIYYDQCMGLVTGEKVLVILGATFGFILSFIHFALLVIRSAIIKDDRPWKRPSQVKLSFFRFDFDITITKRTRRHTCTCCAQLAANRNDGSPSPALSLPATSTG
ncbi:hypothetical protein IFR04_006391 [Cadophora malorum]|uniref:MARVEL domain-containing protein n=1 Tax=Cadophora malorum TaxID=108018 RepID=A0A8H7TK91_9HELO|nr:hypothetical protein IFR04_006391 [Cadophora malorum]